MRLGGMTWVCIVWIFGSGDSVCVCVCVCVRWGEWWSGSLWEHKGLHLSEIRFFIYLFEASLRWTVDCFIMFGNFVFIDGCFFWLCHWWRLFVLLLSFLLWSGNCNILCLELCCAIVRHTPHCNFSTGIIKLSYLILSYVCMVCVCTAACLIIEIIDTSMK